MITDETKTEENQITVGVDNTEQVVDEVESAFEEFNKSTSEQKPEEKTYTSDSSDPTEIDLSQAEDFKLHIFMTIVFMLLDGFHLFLYRFMSKYQLEKEDIALDETDREGLKFYFRTQRVMDMINRLPVEIMGFIHIEYMYFMKFQEHNKKMKALEEEEDDDEDEEFNNDPDNMEYAEIEEVLNKKKEQFEKQKSDSVSNTSKPDNTDSTKAPKKVAKKKATPKKAAKKVPKKVAIKKQAPEEKK